MGSKERRGDPPEIRVEMEQGVTTSDTTGRTIVWEEKRNEKQERSKEIGDGHEGL